MIWIKLFQDESIEDLGYRIARILGLPERLDRIDVNVGTDTWDIGSVNNWRLHSDSSVPGWAKLNARSAFSEGSAALVAVLRCIDGRTVSATEPTESKR